MSRGHLVEHLTQSRTTTSTRLGQLWFCLDKFQNTPRMEIPSPSFINCPSAAWSSWWSTFSNVHAEAEICGFCLLLYQMPLLRTVSSIILVVYLQISLAATKCLFSLSFAKLSHLSLKMMCSRSLTTLYFWQLSLGPFPVFQHLSWTVWPIWTKYSSYSPLSVKYKGIITSFDIFSTLLPM